MERIAIKPKISLWLDTRRSKKGNVFPVKLRVYYNGKPKLFDTGKDLTEDDFNSSYLTPKPRGDFKELKLILSAIELKATEVVSEIKTFSFDSFEKALFDVKSKPMNVEGYYDS